MSNDYRVLQTRHAYRFGPRPESSETHLASEIRVELRSELRGAPRTAHRPESSETHLATETPKRISYRKPRRETRTAKRHVLRHAYRLEQSQRLPSPAPRLVSVPAGVRFEGPLRFSARLPGRARLHASESDTFAGAPTDTEAGYGSGNEAGVGAESAAGGDVERAA